MPVLKPKEKTLTLKQCVRCGHEWYTGLARPVRCAKCKSPYWDTPKESAAAD